MKTNRSFTLHQWLLASAIFSGGLLATRMLVTHTIEYIILPWNLFLAFIPYAITRWMSARPDLFEHRL